VKHRVSEEEYLANARAMGRDNSRTPMQWTAGPNGGFTTGKPWLAVNPNAAAINAEDQAARPDSVLAHTRALIAFRRGSADLREGDYRDIDPDHEQVFAYRRGERLLVLLNFGRETVRYALPEGPGRRSGAGRSGPAEVEHSRAASLSDVSAWAVDSDSRSKILACSSG
jgi:oligo-1,6-glucosidase